MPIAAPDLVLFFFIIFQLSLFNSSNSICQKSFSCGNLDSLEFPLADFKKPECGLFMVNCTDSSNPMIQLSGGNWYHLLQKISTYKYKLQDPSLQVDLNGPLYCLSLRNLSLTNSPYFALTISPKITLFICDNKIYGEEKTWDFFNNCKVYHGCEGFTVFYGQIGEFPNEGSGIPEGCKIIQMPARPNGDSSAHLFDLLTAEFVLEVNVSDACISCHSRGGQCLANRLDQFLCKQDKSRSTIVLAAATSVGSVILLLCLSVVLIIYRCKKRKNGSYILSRNVSSVTLPTLDSERGSFHHGIAVFTFEELEEATKNFDSSRKLGDGGFGTVYYGKLRDGREVAIKRLYEHNCRRVEQFTNEINILTYLRHPNLVVLYGCTSRKSRELLLVYEYVPNGTVADHLHGEIGKRATLTWDVRMSIAVETASALAYLHESSIVHRDVKTNNILLDNNFHVKVADFGLSRLFPNDSSHISTAPHGTPGYVDPEYHQCYQLTEKSDVYSFGVMLIELISSMPAVDIARPMHEINLSNLAVNKIQRCELDELIDSSLGFKTDSEVTRMTTSVAELAFRCLQHEKELRPTMDEVLDILKGIQGGEEGKQDKITNTRNNDFLSKNTSLSMGTDKDCIAREQESSVFTKSCE